MLDEAAAKVDEDDEDEPTVPEVPGVATIIEYYCGVWLDGRLKRL